MTHFHYRLTAALDAHQKAGAHALPLHGAIRQALRVANMRGEQIASALDLARRVPAYLAAEAERFAA